MDVSKKVALQRNREKIVADLEVNAITDDLLSNLVITLDDLESIVSQTERKFRARCLLDILTKKGNEEYDKFVSILEIEHKWLAKNLKQDIGCANQEEHNEEVYCDALTSGDVPQLPMHYIRRISELEEITERLQNLKRGKYVVLHGMTGSGKSVLAVSAVRNEDLIKNNFKNCMYFVNAGEAKTHIDVAQHLYRLYIKLVENNKDLFEQNIEFNYNGIEFMRSKLKNFFAEESRKEGLLILDDVCSMNMIKAFNFGCKTLVTTQDVTVVPKESSNFFEINKGFKEDESLELFSKCTKIEKAKLPRESKEIHSLCKGAPLVIALIGANLEKWNKEANYKERWDLYITMLRNKKDGRLANAIQLFFRRKKEREAQASKNYIVNTIEHCVESLPKPLKEDYKHFALFVEDVNITPKVMEIVLNKSKYEVEEIVSELQNKSLIACAYNVELKSYVYGIHDMLLSHLKSSLSKEEMVKLHNKLVENYLKYSDDNFANLPNDNYIFTYIGYHLLEAKRFEDFPKVYFDLNFIGAKIKAVGIAGLIGDYMRYKTYITKNDKDLIAKLATYESFVQKYGQDLHKYPDTDIIQCGLQQPLTSEVHEAAFRIAQKQCKSTLYLQTQFFGQTVYVTQTLDLKEDVCATCFAHQINMILVGTNSGEINLWDHSFKSKLRTFTGHTQKILFLELSPDASKFLSVSEDGSVKIWSLDDACIKSSGETFDENGFHMNTPPPAIHQKGWMNFFGENVKVDRSKTYQIPNDFITTASFSSDCLLVGTQEGIVKAWDLKDDQEVFKISQGSPITSCTFSLRNTLVIFSCENIILLYDFQTQEYLSQFMNDVRTTSLLVVPYSEMKIVAISDKSVTVWMWKQRYEQKGNICVYDPEMFVLETREDAQFICGAVTWDGVYLVTGSSDNCINMWNIETKEKVKEMTEHNGLVVSLDTYLSSNSSVMYILLSGSDNKTVKQWHIHEVENGNTKKLLTEFSVCWKHGHGSNPLIAAINSDNQIQVFSGHALISESEDLVQPKCLSFSPAGSEVAVGLASGMVIIFDFRNKKYNAVMNLEGAVKYIEYLEDYLVAASENTCLMAYNKNESFRLKAPASRELIDKGKVSRTIKCFSMPDIKRILSVEENGNLKLWHFNSIEDVLVVKENSTVTMATMSFKKDMIAFAFSDRFFRIYNLEVTSNKLVTCFYKQGKLLDEIPRSCCFSKDGKILALGQDSGNIVLWSIEYDTQVATLELHKSWVRNLYFSPAALAGAPLVLVSVGDLICWWNISHVFEKFTDKSRRSSRGRGHVKLSGDLTINNLGTLMNENWVDKKSRPHRQDLLSAIKLAGVHAIDVAISPNFNCFVTVDASGLLYIMNVLEPSNAL